MKAAVAQAFGSGRTYLDIALGLRSVKLDSIELASRSNHKLSGEREAKATIGACSAWYLVIAEAGC